MLQPLGILFAEIFQYIRSQRKAGFWRAGLTREKAREVGLYANLLMKSQARVDGVKLKQQLNLGSFLASDAKFSCNSEDVLHEAQSCRVASCFYSAGISIGNQSLKGLGAADSQSKAASISTKQSPE
jgi:hypothetical protein